MTSTTAPRILPDDVARATDTNLGTEIGITELDPEGYIEGCSPTHGWFCIELDPDDIDGELTELGFTPDEIAAARAAEQDKMADLADQIAEDRAYYGKDY